MKKILMYALASIGGALAGFSLTMILLQLLGEGGNAIMYILLAVGLALAAAAVFTGERKRKALGIAYAGAGGAVVGTGIVQLLVGLSRGDVSMSSVMIALGGVLVAFIGFAVLARGMGGESTEVGVKARSPRPVLIGLGALVLIAGIALDVWSIITELGVLLVLGVAAGVLLYLFGLYTVQHSDDKAAVEAAFRLLEDVAAEGVERQHAVVNRRTFSHWFGQMGAAHIGAIIAVVYSGFPIMYVISASLNPNGTLTGSNVLFASASTANFEALNNSRYWEWFQNSLQISSITAVSAVLMGAAAAYAFSRYRFKGRRPGLMALLVIQMFPQILAFVAIFLLLMTLGFVWPPLGLNSKLALIAVYLGGALGANTFLMYGFFNTIPKDLDEAAKIDGASHAQIFWTIILRLVAPILAVVALLSFIGTFNDFVLAKVILQSQSNWTLAVGMFQWVSDLLNQNWGLFAAGAVIGAIPILILFLALQKYIVGGLTAGSVKG